MEELRRAKCLWLVLLFCAFSPWCCGKFIPENFEKKLVALSKVVEYIRNRLHQMNPDVTFSITIVEANIVATFFHENSEYLDPRYRVTLKEILERCDFIRRYQLDNIVSENKDIQLLHEMLNNPILWTRKIFWRNGTLCKAHPSRFISEYIYNLTMQGSPNEEESDRCLSEIVRNKLKSSCRLPQICSEILSTHDSARGYPLNHRLLALQVIRAMDCVRDTSVFSDLIVSYCSKILQDLIDIEAAGFPYQTPDLMMEQILLCGMEGFLEFTSEQYDKLVLDWSRPSGCFSSFGPKFFATEKNVVRRASLKTDFGCDSHATGIAAAFISLFIRENLENAFE